MIDTMLLKLDVSFVDSFLNHKRDGAITGICMWALCFYYVAFGLKINRPQQSNVIATARWRTLKEQKKYFGEAPIDTTQHLDVGGAPVHMISDKTLLYETDSFHDYCVGTTGSGKSRKIVRQLVMLASMASESMIFHDPKKEMYNGFHLYLSKKGFKVHVIDFRNPEYSDHWNPLDDITDWAVKDPDEADEYAQDQVESIVDGNSNSEPIWIDGQKALIISSLLEVASAPIARAKKNNLIKSPAFEMTETHEIQSIVSELEDKQEELIQQFRNRSLDKKKEISGLTPEKLTDENIKIKGFRNDRVEMSIDTWNQIKSSHNRLVDTYNTLKEQFADLITKYFRLKEVFIKKAEDVFELFHRIRRSPRQVKIEEYEHAHEQILQSEISKKRLLAENERLIQSIQNKTEIIEDYQEQLSTKNELISDTIDFLDAFENNGISLLESFAYRNNWNYDYLKSFIPERSMQKQHDDWEIER